MFTSLLWLFRSILEFCHQFFDPFDQPLLTKEDLHFLSISFRVPAKFEYEVSEIFEQILLEIMCFLYLLLFLDFDFWLIFLIVNSHPIFA